MPPALKTHSLLLVIACAACLTTSNVAADDWPNWGGPQGDIVWREDGIVDKLPKSDGLMPRVWSAPIGEGYSGPAVAAGRVFVTDLIEHRTERVLCLDAETGKQIWKHEYPVRYTVSYPAGPRATPLVDGKHVYTIGAMGDMFCLTVATGDVVWKKNFTADFGTKLPIWGMAASPLLHGNQLLTLVGGSDGALMVSFDKLTGKELWRALDDPTVGYAPPVLHDFGGVPQVICWHPTAISSIDPTNGKLIWEVPFRVRSGLTIPMPRRVGRNLFVTSFYNGPMMLEVAEDGRSAKVAWQGKSDSEIKTDGLHSIMPTPVFDGEHIFGICSYGQLRCLNAKTGQRQWETAAATGKGRWWNAFLIQHKDRFFIHNEQGDLITAQLNAEGYQETSRAKLIEPTRKVQRRMTIWSHPAFAMKSVFARNDTEIVRVNLAAEVTVAVPAK